MRKLNVYMLKSYLGPFVFTFFISLFILLLQFLWKYIDDLVGKGLEWYIIGKLMFYASSTFVPLALPLAILLASIMTFGNMGEHYELVAMKSAGISLRKAMKPLIILSVFISLSALFFSNYVLPVANLKFGSLLYDVRQQKLAFNLNEGIFYDGLDGFVIRAGRKDKDNKTIYDVQIYNHADRSGNIKVTTARKGIIEMTANKQKIVFTLFDGSSYVDDIKTSNYRKSRPFEITRFEKQVLTFNLDQFNLNRTNEDLFRSHYSMLNIKQLNYSIDSLSEARNIRGDKYRDDFLVKKFNYLSRMDSSNLSSYETLDSIAIDSLKYPILENFNVDERLAVMVKTLQIARDAKDKVINFKNEVESRQLNIIKHEVVWHQKFKLSLACLIFFFIGAPLGAIIRKGGLGLPVVVSVIFFVLYHVVSMMGEKAAKAGEWDIIFGSWLSTAIILPLGLFLTYKATTDAPLLDAESWKKFFQRFKFVASTLNQITNRLKKQKP